MKKIFEYILLIGWVAFSSYNLSYLNPYALEIYKIEDIFIKVSIFSILIIPFFLTYNQILKIPIKNNFAEIIRYKTRFKYFIHLNKITILKIMPISVLLVTISDYLPLFSFSLSTNELIWIIMLVILEYWILINIQIIINLLSNIAISQIVISIILLFGITQKININFQFLFLNNLNLKPILLIPTLFVSLFLQYIAIKKIDFKGENK